MLFVYSQNINIIFTTAFDKWFSAIIAIFDGFFRKPAVSASLQQLWPIQKSLNLQEQPWSLPAIRIYPRQLPWARWKIRIREYPWQKNRHREVWNQGAAFSVLRRPGWSASRGKFRYRQKKSRIKSRMKSQTAGSIPGCRKARSRVTGIVPSDAESSSHRKNDGLAK